MKCPFCGSTLEANAKYCNDCGTAVDSPESHRTHNVYKGNPTYVPQQKQSPFAQRKPVSQVQEPQYRQRTNTPQSISNAPYNKQTAKKKSGCGIVIFIIVMLFFAFGMINSILGDGWLNKVEDFFNKLDSGEEITLFDDSHKSFSWPYGAVIDNYYENEDADLSFRFPDGFVQRDESFDERELVGSYSNEFEIVKDNIFIEVVLTDDYDNPTYCLQRYGVNMIEALYDSYSSDDLECDGGFSVESIPFRDSEENSITFNYSVGGEKHVVTMVGFAVGDTTLIAYVNSPSADVNRTILNQFDVY